MNRAAIAVDNARLYSEVQSALQSRDEFLSVASHELKTPLTSLYLQLQILERRLNEMGAINEFIHIDNLLKIVGLCRNQSIKLSDLINTLLDLTLIRSGQLQLKCECWELNLFLEEIVTRLNTQFSQNEIFITLQKYSATPILVEWDRMRLEQVIVNLLSNAIKYGEGKPIKISVALNSEKGITIKLKIMESVYPRVTTKNL